MQNNPTHIIDQLDLTHPEDLLIAFHYLRSWPTIEPFPELKAYLEQFEIIQHYAPMIFGQPDEQHTAATVEHFMFELGGTEPGKTPDAIRPLAPREWLYVWRAAFDREVIGPIAFGAAFRFFMIGTGGNGAPGHAADSLEARRVMLSDLRRASAESIMDHNERHTLAGLPDMLTLYRGGRSSFGLTPLDRALALHWALDVEYAATYMRGRGAHRTLAAMNITAETIASLSPIELDRWVRLAARKPSAIEELGQPFLLRAVMPKELALAYIGAGVDGQLVELLIDFDKITADMIEDITPARYRWAA